MKNKLILLNEETVNYSENRKQLCNSTKDSVGETAFNQKYPGKCDEWESKRFVDENAVKKTYETSIATTPNKLFTGSLEEFYKKYACDKFPNNQYCKTQTNNTDEKPWPDEFKCVTTGTKQQYRNPEDGFYYTLKINNEDWDFNPYGKAGRTNESYWSNKYKCDNGKPIIYSFCDLDGKELKGKDGDPWEYKKINMYDETYCIRKQGDSKWKYLIVEDPENKKAIDAIAKKFETEGGNTEIGVNSGNTITVGDKKKEEVKYPSKAPQNIVDRFDSKYPCLKDLPTMVNLDKDGNEYYYKVEKPTEDETVYYYMSGKCKIKTGEQISSKYFKCPEK